MATRGSVVREGVNTRLGAAGVNWLVLALKVAPLLVGVTEAKLIPLPFKAATTGNIR